MTTNITDKWESLCRLAESEMKRNHIPGASLGLVFGDDLYMEGFGVTNLNNPQPVEATTLFQIGSITKTFTGATTMRLVQEGRLSLQTPVKDIDPKWRVADASATRGATIWHLLTHTAGWLGDFFIDTGEGDDALDRYASRMAELPQITPLGMHYSYNNASFALLGHLLEIVEEKPFEQIVADDLIKPLNLSDTHFKAGEIMTKRFAVGHIVQDDTPEVAIPWGIPRYAVPMGSIISNVPDLLTYARFMLDGGLAKDGSRVLAEESVGAMLSPQKAIWKDSEAIGLAWHVDKVAGETFLHHGGATHGQGAWLEYCPSRGFALAILGNSDTTRHLFRAVRRRALRDFLGIQMSEENSQPMTNEQMREIEGRYLLPKLGFTEIRIIAGKLVGGDINTGGFPTEDTPPQPSPPPYTLELTEPDRMKIVDGKYRDTICDILRDDAGEMVWLRKSGRIHLTEPIPGY